MSEDHRPTRPDTVRVAAAQMHCRPGDVAANLETIERLVAAAAADGAALVVLPETATTGYFVTDRLAALAEPADGPTAARLSCIAAAQRLHLAVGMIVREGTAHFDAQLLFAPDGALLACYHKAHLFSTERQTFRAGDRPVVVDTAIGRIGMTVCYDLIFPEYVRRLVDLGADLVINSTNWITDDFQREHWGWGGATVTALACTRALENGVGVVMADCVGPEWVFDSIGHSCVVAPSGRVLASAGTAQGVAVADIVYRSDALDRWKAIATYRQDRRPELYR